MISIIIPLHNKEEYIVNTVESVLNQSFIEFELLIIDDGSTDNSKELVKNIKDNRIKLISIDNSGVSIARNTGIKNAKSDWIAFLDADDWWEKTFLEEIYKTINKHPQHKIFASGRSRVFKEHIERYEHGYLPKEGTTNNINYFKVISKYLPLINASNTVIKKSHFFERGFFRKGQLNHEDHDLWMRLCINEEVVFVNKNLSFYRKDHENSASKNLYIASDFCVFLNTIIEVRDQLTDKEKQNFRKYYNKFILQTFIKNYGDYSKLEEVYVFQLAKMIVTGKYLYMLRILKLIPYKKSYKFLKYFK